MSPIRHTRLSRSTNPANGETKLIEVKGHSDNVIFGDLSEPEYDLAEKESYNYWLYIVYNIGCGKPKHLAFQRPIKNHEY